VLTIVQIHKEYQNYVHFNLKFPSHLLLLPSSASPGSMLERKLKLRVIFTEVSVEELLAYILCTHGLTTVLRLGFLGDVTVKVATRP
jgi:hypothetical protein